MISKEFNILRDEASRKLSRRRQAGALKEWTPGLAEEFSRKSVETLIFDPYFLNLDGIIYPKVADKIIALYWERKKRLEDNKTPVQLVVFEEAIGAGKTYQASVITWLEWFYLSTAGVSPQITFGLAPDSKLAIILFSLNARKARSVTFTTLQPLFNSAFNRDYFRPNPKIVTQLDIPQNNTLIFPGTGEAASALGFDIYTAVIDEANFIESSGGRTNVDKELGLDQAEMMETQITERQSSRFADKHGFVPSPLVAISAIGDEWCYTRRKIKKAQKESRRGITSKTWWIRSPRWESSKTVQYWWWWFDAIRRWELENEIVDLYGKNYLGFIIDIRTQEIVKLFPEDVLFIMFLRCLYEFWELEYNEPPPKQETFSYSLGKELNDMWKSGEITYYHFAFSKRFVLCPISRLLDAQTKPEIFLRETANVAIATLSPFIRDQSSIEKAVDMERKSPLIVTGSGYPILADDLVCRDSYYRFIHGDLSIKQDAMSIGMVKVPHFVSKHQWDEESKQKVAVYSHFFEFDLIQRIPTPSGREADYDLILDLILDLRDRGFPIALATFDRFQSHAIKTELRKNGIVSAILSIDHTSSKVVLDSSQDEGYKKKSTGGDYDAAMVSLKNALGDRRIIMPDHAREPRTDVPYFIYESKNLEWVADKGKVLKKRGYSDDVVQCAAGCVFNAENNIQYISEEEPEISGNLEDTIESLDRDDREFYELVNSSFDAPDIPVSGDNFEIRQHLRSRGMR